MFLFVWMFLICCWICVRLKECWFFILFMILYLCVIFVIVLMLCMVVVLLKLVWLSRLLVILFIFIFVFFCLLCLIWFGIRDWLIVLWLIFLKVFLWIILWGLKDVVLYYYVCWYNFVVLRRSCLSFIVRMVFGKLYVGRWKNGGNFIEYDNMFWYVFFIEGSYWFCF